MMTFEAALLLAQFEMPGWIANLWSIFLLVLGFSLVIFVHELGHFLVAKWAKVRVERFAIGFGKELFGFSRGGTRYSFNILPLGGYVKMLGQEDFVVDKSGELKVKDDPDSFTNKPVRKRMAIVSAGVVMNLLFAAVAFAIVVMVGRLERPPVIGVVQENSPAGRAGLQPGDRILAVNDQLVRNFSDLSMSIVLSDPDEDLELTVLREGRRVEPRPKVRPEFRKDVQIRQIGIGSGMNRRVILPSLAQIDEPAPSELQEKDELVKLAADAGAKEHKDVGTFLRAILAARGAPTEVIVRRPKDPATLTNEMCLEGDLDIETTEVSVQLKALWVPLAYQHEDTVTGSLLGLVPRLTVLSAEKDKSFDLAGVQPGDVITRIGSYESPNRRELKNTIEENADAKVRLEVRRPNAPCRGLAARTVAFCVKHRETLILAASADVGRALQKASELAVSAGLPDPDREKLLTALGGAGDGAGWRRWLEQVDIHKLDGMIPKRPFALLKEQLPQVDAILHCVDEDHLVVADVVAKLGEQISPAKAAGIPRGAVILSVNGQRIRQWYELSEAFRAEAGRTVDFKYRVADETQTTKFAVPDCLSAALDIPPGARVVSIAGQTSHAVSTDEDATDNVALPDWRAVRGLLADAVGQTVTVRYATIDGEELEGTYAVTAGNVDPWLHRVRFAPSFACYPLLEKNPIRNPILAVGVGFKQAYQATMRTIQSIRHMVFTRKVGLSKVSGPVGIIRMGTKFADSGLLDLLWFLAVISANLAVINFLPMPIVDGGLFLFLVMEKIRGEAVSIKTQIATQLIGIALIATVFLLVTYQDIKNWILGT